MSVTTSVATAGRDTKQVVGLVLTGLVTLFLLFDAISHIAQPQVVLDSMKELGFPTWAAPVFGVLELVFVALYLYRRTNVLGALLITAYLGGAVCANVIDHAPVVSTMLFPVYIALFVWGGLWFRDADVRRMLPIRH